MSSTIRRDETPTVSVVQVADGNAVARVVAVKTRDEVRIQTGWVSEDNIRNIAAHKMTHTQATALRDALTAALEART